MNQQKQPPPPPFFLSRVGDIDRDRETEVETQRQRNCSFMNHLKKLHVHNAQEFRLRARVSVMCWCATQRVRAVKG